MGDKAVAYAPEADEPEVMGARAELLDHVQRRLLYAGRILLTGGWLVLSYAMSNGAANEEHALLGLVLLLLGVFFIMLAPVANQFPGAAGAGAAVADAVLFYFFAPPN
jgi:hypothetical protein